jgi:hypothetical protein
MADGDLTQVEADALIAMEKIRADAFEYEYPQPGGKLVIPLTSIDKREAFLLDVTRGQVNLAKVTRQNRAKQVVVLMRLDLGGSPHRNPDGKEIACPHLHFYKEGYGDKWAVPVSSDKCRNTEDLLLTFEDFMTHCNITEKPRFQMGLF